MCVYVVSSRRSKYIDPAGARGRGREGRVVQVIINKAHLAAGTRTCRGAGASKQLGIRSQGAGRGVCETGHGGDN